MSNPSPTHKFGKTYKEPISEQPLTVRVPLYIDKYVRSRKDRTEWLRRAIANAYYQEIADNESRLVD